MAPNAQKATLLALTTLASTSMAFPQINSDYGSDAYGGSSGIATAPTAGSYSYSYTASIPSGTAYSFPYSGSFSTGFSYSDSFSTGTQSYPTQTYSTSFPSSTGSLCGDISNLDERCNVLFPYVGQGDLAAVCELFLQAQSSGCNCGGGSITTSTPPYPEITSTSTGIFIDTTSYTFCADCPSSTPVYPVSTGTGFVTPGVSSSVATPVPTSPSGSNTSFTSFAVDTPLPPLTRPTGTGITYASPTISSAVDTPSPLTASSSYGSGTTAYESSSTTCTDHESGTSTDYGYATPTPVLGTVIPSSSDSHGSAATTSLGGYGRM